MDTLDARKEIESYINSGAPYWAKELCYEGLEKFEKSPEEGWNFCLHLEAVLELLVQYNDTLKAKKPV